MTASIKLQTHTVSNTNAISILITLSCQALKRHHAWSASQTICSYLCHNSSRSYIQSNLCDLHISCDGWYSWLTTCLHLELTKPHLAWIHLGGIFSLIKSFKVRRPTFNPEILRQEEPSLIWTLPSAGSLYKWYGRKLLDFFVCLVGWLFCCCCFACLLLLLLESPFRHWHQNLLL